MGITGKKHDKKRSSSKTSGWRSKHALRGLKKGLKESSSFEKWYKKQGISSYNTDQQVLDIIPVIKDAVRHKLIKFLKQDPPLKKYATAYYTDNNRRFVI